MNLIVRGNTIKYVRVPDVIVDVVMEIPKAPSSVRHLFRHRLRFPRKYGRTCPNVVLRVQPIDVCALLTSSLHVYASIYELSTIFSGAVAEAAVVGAGVALVVVRAAARPGVATSQEVEGSHVEGTRQIQAATETCPRALDRRNES
jgi:hypothetical protein